MSCDSKFKAFIRHPSVTGAGTPLASAFGSPEAAQDALQELYDVAKARPLPTAPAELAMMSLQARALLAQMKTLGIDAPTHAASGLPEPAAQQGYMEIFRAWQAAAAQRPLPQLAQDVRAAQQARQAAAELATQTVSPVAGAAQTPDIPQLLQLAAQTRTDAGDVEPQARDRVLAALPREHLDGPLNGSSLTPFVARQLGRNADELQLMSPDAIGAQGASGDAVFLVRDATGAVQAVLKAYRTADTLTRDLSVMARLNEDDARRIRIPAVRGLAVVDEAGQRTGLLLMDTAPGRAIDKWMVALSDTEGAERTQRLGTLDQAVGATAELLAQLHTQLRGSQGRVSDQYMARFFSEIRDLSAKIMGNADVRDLGLDQRLLQERTATLERAMRADPGPSALAHNDAHQGNFFYDPQQGATMIDLTTMHRSMNARSELVGAAARDTAYFVQKLIWFRDTGGLSDDELSALETRFYMTYRVAGGPVIPSAADRFFRLRTVLGELQYRATSTAGDPDARLLRLIAQIGVVNDVLHQEET